jgi:hypothetical protein
VLPKVLISCFSDKDYNVVYSAILACSDLLKLANDSELEKIYEEQPKLVKELKKKE